MTSAKQGRRLVAEVALSVGAVAGLLCAISAVLALALDLRVLAFRSGSMAPTIATGALALARTTPAADLRVGDVVTVPTAGGSRVTHRIVRIEHHGGGAVLELRGDANNASDPAPYEVPRADRVLFAVPRLGYVAGAVTSQFGLVALGLYAAFLLRYLLPRRGAARHREDRVVAAAVLACALAATGTLTARSHHTWAAWLNSAATTGSTFSTYTVPAPTSFSCGALGFFSVSFSWAAVPGATSYVLHYGSGGSQTTAPLTGTSRTVATVISGGTAWVTANRYFGSTTWTSAASSTRSYSVLALSVCA